MGSLGSNSVPVKIAKDHLEWGIKRVTTSETFFAPQTC